jgi:hypothetical protein
LTAQSFHIMTKPLSNTTTGTIAILAILAVCIGIAFWVGKQQSERILEIKFDTVKTVQVIHDTVKVAARVVKARRDTVSRILKLGDQTDTIKSIVSRATFRDSNLTAYIEYYHDSEKFKFRYDLYKQTTVITETITKSNVVEVSKEKWIVSPVLTTQGQYGVAVTYAMPVSIRNVQFGLTIAITN